ncbi:MAG: PQQ-dependent sugar dehydrogenase [Isosphaeraceae bacterium]
MNTPGVILSSTTTTLLTLFTAATAMAWAETGQDVPVGTDAPPRSEKPFGLETRVPWTTSRVVGSPDPLPPFQLVRSFRAFTFKNPIFIAQEPTSERFLVAEALGQILSVKADDPTGRKDLVLDIGRSLSAFSFHPDYANNGQIFVFSQNDPKVQPVEDQRSRVSRYTLDPGNDQRSARARPDSETVIIEWPAGGHNGGEAVIGPDGYLYVTTGDGTGGSDPKATGQGVDDLLSVMMRLDVDHPDPGRAYSIPRDNPFVNTPGARPEIWSYGFRNPWRFSFDPVSGRPWVGDVGQDLWELIELSGPGLNHGWSVMEGSHPFHPAKKRGPTPIVPPVVEHHHTECRSIIGGYVYQGEKFEELKDAYIYGDYEYGKMWGLRYDHAAGEVVWHRELADSNVRISSFGVGRDGSFHALDYDRGEVYELARQPPAPPSSFPRKLSQTGLFASVKGHVVAPGVIPYSINAPFWSDGAHKERFLALPGDAKVTNPEGSWTFEDGTVTVKSFALDVPRRGDAANRAWIETRIVVKQDNHWVGYTYAWNDEQTDAELVDARGMDRTYVVRDPSAPKGERTQVWHYPSRNECMFCHSRAAGFVLGLNVSQMNRDHDYGGVVDNQLRALDHVGVFTTRLGKSPAELPRLPDPRDAGARLDDRARAYLQVNCAMCHVSDGGGNSLMELGFSTPLEKTNVVDVRPIHDTFSIPDARLVAPGDPERSVLYQRIARRGTGQMPPTSTNLVDAESAQLIADWIRGMPRAK